MGTGGTSDSSSPGREMCTSKPEPTAEAGSTVTVNILLPGGRGTLTGMVPDDAPAEVRARLLDPAVMGPPIVWLASERAAGVHDRRIVANEFDAASAAP